MSVAASRAYGCQSMTAPLRRVLVRRPPADCSDWRRVGWRAAPDPLALAREHEAFCALVEGTGADVVVGQAETLDAIYAFDPAIVGDTGAILLRPGKGVRVDEPASIEPELERAGIPVAERLEAPATAEGGDTAWLDERTLLVGRGYRTNDAGIAALRAALPGVEVLAFDLPHLRGAGDVLHLMSLLSPLADDLALVYLPLLPVRLVELLSRRGVRLVEVPEDEFQTMGANVLALAPRVALALDGNRETRRRLERTGVDVTVYEGDEISRKGDGGPTCLTRPLLRG